MITSRNNPAIKALRSLRQRRERTSSGLYWVEGIRLVAEAVQLGAEIAQLVVAPELLHSAFAQQLVAEAGLEVLEVSGEVFASLSAKDGPQGLAAVVRQRWDTLEALEGQQLWVALSAVSDPGNLGTILRTSDAVGATGMILIDASTDPFDPAAVRASMGAIFSQRLVRVTWGGFQAWQRSSGWSIVGTNDSATTDYQEHRYPRPLVLLMGSEREGLSIEQQSACSAMVRIPMVGRADSLNLAVATSVLLYEIINQARAEID